MSPEYTVSAVVEEPDGGEEITYNPVTGFYPTAVVTAAEELIAEENPGLSKPELADAVIDYLLAENGFGNGN